MEETDTTIPERLAKVRAHLAEAAARSGRDPASVALLAAVKSRSAEEIRTLVSAGVTLLGENRVQEGESHLAELGGAFREGVTVRFIGRLQANKARKAIKAFDAIDTVDGTDLARRLSRLAQEESLTREVLLEVNLGSEEQKGGVAPAEAAGLAAEVARLPGLVLSGLQGVSPLFEGAEASRPYFRRLASLFQEIRRGLPGRSRSGIFPWG